MMSEIQGEQYYYSRQQQGIDRRMKEYLVEKCLAMLKGPAVLDLGFVDGIWTDRILARGWSSAIVEGAAKHVAVAHELYDGRTGVTIHHAMFEEFEAPRTYNSIIAGDILRYIEDPVPFLRRLGAYLAPGGRLAVTVPNSRSLHRRIGTLMGMEPHPAASNARDREVGNLRSYDRYQLRHELQSAGLSVLELRGCFLKPLSSLQMEDWSDDLLKAFLEIGEELQDYAWFPCAIAAREE